MRNRNSPRFVQKTPCPKDLTIPRKSTRHIHHFRTPQTLAALINHTSKCTSRENVISFLDSVRLILAQTRVLAASNQQLEQCRVRTMTVNSGMSSSIGRRSSNEDYHFSFRSRDSVFQMISDGHGGATVAKIITEEIGKVVQRSDVHGDLTKIDITSEWDKINNSIRTLSGGSCSIAASIVTEGSHFKLTVANVGDSVCIAGHLCANNGTRFGRDHHPNADGETARIRRAGGYVYGNRVSGVLAISRAFADWNYTGVICTPEIHTHTFSNSQPVLLITACDGFFEEYFCNRSWTDVKCFTVQTLWEYINKLITENPSKDLTWVATQVSNKAFEMGSNDNLTICISVIQMKTEN
jgi:serine/threonine protein phosphatase PrpC